MIAYEPWPPRQFGGQQAGMGSNGVKATHYTGHYPSGITAFCEYHRSQHKNRQVVQEMIEWACASIGIEA